MCIFFIIFIFCLLCRFAGRRVAIKKITNVFENRQEAKRILRECRILRVLKNCAYISDVVEVLPPLDFNNFRDLCVAFMLCLCCVTFWRMCMWTYWLDPCQSISMAFFLCVVACAASSSSSLSTRTSRRSRHAMHHLALCIRGAS